ncbi:hypothetical protein CR513_47367, partial [Mucuna pruriens]
MGAFDLGFFLVHPPLCHKGFRCALKEEMTSTVMSITVRSGSSFPVLNLSLRTFLGGCPYFSCTRERSRGHLAERPRLVFIIPPWGIKTGCSAARHCPLCGQRVDLVPLRFANASRNNGSKTCFGDRDAYTLRIYTWPLRNISHTWNNLFGSAEPVPLAIMPELMEPAGVPSRSTEHYEEWVSPNILKHVPKIKPSKVDRLVAKGTWVDPSSTNNFIMQAPFDDECICHAALEDKDDFIFMYETVFEDLGVSMPFDFFYAEVLRMLGIPPSQLHPNSWVVLRAFDTVCQAFSLSPTTSLLFSFYTARICQGATWVSLVAMHYMNLFCPYLESYKGLKTRYIKIIPIKSASLTMDEESIPWYWHIPNRVQGLSLEDLNVGDQADYNLGALIQRSQVIARNAPVEQVDVPTSPLPSSPMPVVQQGSILKPISASPPSLGLKRKGASSPHQDGIKRAKTTEASPAVVLSSKVKATSEGASPISIDQRAAAIVTIADSSTPPSVEFAGLVLRSTSKGDTNTAASASELGVKLAASASEVDSLWGIRLDSPSLKLGVKLAACDRESLLAIGPGNSLKVAATSYIRVAAVLNTLRPAFLKTEKLAQEGLWSQQEMAKLLNDLVELRQVN